MSEQDTRGAKIERFCGDCWRKVQPILHGVHSSREAKRKTVSDDWEGDLGADHPNRCRLRDNLLYADILNDDGTHRKVWRCHKREGHDGPCSAHNDCGVLNAGGVVCGLLPGHDGPHAWETQVVVKMPDVEPASSGEADRLAAWLEQYGRHLEQTHTGSPEQFNKAAILLRQQVDQIERERANEALALCRLSETLTGGNAGTWDEVFHAAEQAEAELARLRTVIDKWHARTGHGFDPEEDPETTAYWNGVKAVTQEAKP